MKTIEQWLRAKADDLAVVDYATMNFANSLRGAADRIAELEAEVARLREAQEIADRRHAADLGTLSILGGENRRLREAIATADLQIGDGHIENARATLHAAMDAT